MTNEEIKEGNKIIAESPFSEFDRHFESKGELGEWWHCNDKQQFLTSDLKYHSSWDWLIPVIEKIESLGFTNRIQSTYEGKQNCEFWEGSEYNSISNIHGETKIEVTYKSVIEFIKWYNQTQKSHE